MDNSPDPPEPKAQIRQADSSNESDELKPLDQMAQRRRERSESKAMLESGLKFSYVGLEFGVAVGLGWYFGSWLDRKWGTAPKMMYVCIALGFATAVRDLYRVARQVRRELDADDNLDRDE